MQETTQDDIDVVIGDLRSASLDAPAYDDAPHSAEEMEEMVEAQRELSERIPTVHEHVELGTNTGGCRISDFNSVAFETTGPKANKLRRELVGAAASASAAARRRGYFEIDEAKAVVAELLVAANNELAPSEETEVLFGIFEPDWQVLAGMFAAGPQTTSEFDEACLGLLVYRAWKIMFRVPLGRAIILTDGAATVEEMDPDILNSFDAVQSVLAVALVEDCLCRKFIEWVEMLPTSKVMTNTVLSPVEKRFLLTSVRNGHVDWHSTRVKCT